MPLKRSVRALLGAVTLLTCGQLVSGCGKPPNLDPSPPPRSPSMTSSPSAPGLPPGFTLSPSLIPRSPVPFPETTAAACAGQPSGEQIIALVKRTIPLSPNTKATLGPLCAGDWQYTILEVPGSEPLQVVSSGPPKSLTLVTAGTDICTIEVRNYAPPGIRLAASC